MRRLGPTSRWLSWKQGRFVRLVVAALCVIALLAFFHFASDNLESDTLEAEYWRRLMKQFPLSSHTMINVTYIPQNLSQELTVVTAYFNIGEFDKGRGWFSPRSFSPSLYQKWLKVFAHVDNALVVYVDSEEGERLFAAARRHLPAERTRIVRLDRARMASFRLVPRIAHIFAQPGYPRHQPNTVVPGYSAAMHAKYEVMEAAVRDNPFRTKYFCWLDVGLFRDVPHRAFNDTSARFSLFLPKDFQPSSVAYTEVKTRNSKLYPMEIVRDNRVWVCGCFFLARWDVMLLWVAEYLAAVQRLLDAGVMSTDQQVIYALCNTMQPRTHLQLYRGDGRYNEWFHLGYIARDAGRERSAASSTTNNATSNAASSTTSYTASSTTGSTTINAASSAISSMTSSTTTNAASNATVNAVNKTTK